MNINSQTLTNIFLVGIFVMMAYLVFSEKDIAVDMSTGERDRTISVKGEAETFVAPDTASVSFSVTKKASTTDVAMNSVNERMQVLMKDMKSVGVEEKDIKTMNYDVDPEYRYDEGRRIFEGYRASQRVEITIRDLGDVSKVLSTVNSAGVDDVSNLKFFVQNDAEIRDELREKAIDDAQEKAKDLAKDLGVNLHQIVGFSESGKNVPEPVYRGGVMMEKVASDAEPVIPEGENQFKTQVTVIYKID